MKSNTDKLQELVESGALDSELQWQLFTHNQDGTHPGQLVETRTHHRDATYLDLIVFFVAGFAIGAVLL